MTPSQDPGCASCARANAAEEVAPDPFLAGLDLNSAADRLQTFVDWPVSFLKKEDLAAAGLYYTRRNDLVKCPYCKVEIGQWRPGDDPDKEHRKFSSPIRCVFLRWCRTATPGNTSPADIENDTCGPGGLAAVAETLLLHDKLSRATMGELYHNATYVTAHRDYFFYCDRLRSFDSWTDDAKVPKEALSDAGFYYLQDFDRTRCFHCSGNLRQWSENDDPWEEHAAWFPDCKFVLVMKGQKFIDAARAKKLAANDAGDGRVGRVQPDSLDT